MNGVNSGVVVVFSEVCKQNGHLHTATPRRTNGYSVSYVDLPGSVISANPLPNSHLQNLLRFIPTSEIGVPQRKNVTFARLFCRISTVSAAVVRNRSKASHISNAEVLTY
jgi:hypothetical protein